MCFSGANRVQLLGRSGRSSSALYSGSDVDEGSNMLEPGQGIDRYLVIMDLFVVI